MLNRWQRTVVDLQGNVAPHATLIVRKESDQSLVTAYRDRNGTVPYPAGLITADEKGYAYFYVSAGIYRITSVGLDIDWRDIQLDALRQTTSIPLEDYGPIYVPGQGPMEWDASSGKYEPIFAPLSGGRALNTQIFDVPGSYEYAPTAGTKKVRVRVVGGGGGGGGIAGASASAWAAASGGAAGAYSESIIPEGLWVPGSSITVGAGGAGAVAGANSGSTGGTSSFASILSATGGGGGTGVTASTSVNSLGGGAGGEAAGGQINARGNGGGTSINTASSSYQSGIGAGSFYGGGANSRRSGNQGAGINGSGPGSGGSGAAAGGGAATGNFAGGSGANGIVVIEEFS